MVLAASARLASLIAGLDPADLAEPASARPFDSLSDAELSDAAARVISHPRAEPADSFVLHAPLELLARTALLSLVDPADRDLSRRRMLWLAATYAAAGPPVGDDDHGSTTMSLPAAAPATSLDLLQSAIDRGDLDGADAAVGALAAVLPAADLAAALTDLVLPRLSAAAHGNIFLYQLPRIAPRSRVGATMARGLVRELARYPEWNLTWQLDRRSGPGTSSTRSGRVDPGDDLVDVLLGPRSPGALDSNFIFPTMSLVEQSGLAVELLDQATGSIGLRSARKALLRVAAWSMLQDDPDQAPYGWSHCLTMPQAALGIAPAADDPGQAVAIAATYVLGFRSTQGKIVLDPAWEPEPLAADPGAPGVLDALAGRPSEAAAAAWHAPDTLMPDVVTHLAGYAAAHPDAHLAKYTVACLDAASADPRAAHVFVAAAAFLGAWWRQLPSDDPLLAA